MKNLTDSDPIENGGGEEEVTILLISPVGDIDDDEFEERILEPAKSALASLAGSKPPTPR